MSRVIALRERAVDLGYAAAWQLVRTMPEPLARVVFDRSAAIGYRRDGRGTRQLRRNLRRVVGPLMPEPELDELVRAGLRSYARYWLETFRLPAMDKRDVARRFHISGVMHLDASANAGRGVIVVLPHMGNWDIAAVWLLAHGQPFTTVAERLKPESLFDRFVAYREGLGMEILPLTGGARPTVEVLTERLRAGGCICLLGDRDLSARGVEVTFFGEPARLPAGPALLAAQTGAALHTVSVWNEGPDWAANISEPLKLSGRRLSERAREGTQQVADALAAEISARPQDWHMLQRLWIADLPAVSTAAASRR